MIRSIHNRRVSTALRLKKRAMREKDRRFLVEGARGVAEGLAARAIEEVFADPASGQRLDPVIDAARRGGVPVHEVSTEVMGHLTSTVTPQGVVAVAGFVDVLPASVVGTARCLPVLVEVRDPGNAGTILRSADASDAAGVVFTHSSVDVYNPKTVRASAGSLFHVPVVREARTKDVVRALRDTGWRILAAAADGERSIYEADLTGPAAVLFGNEARGLPGEARALADGSVRVPIGGRAESLNLAAAATLVLFESARQRAGQVDPLAQIVAGAAHDIRSPLTAVRGFALTLRSRWGRLTDDQRLMMLEGIANDAARMDVVVAQLVDAARLRSGSLHLDVRPLDLLEEATRCAGEAGAWGQTDVQVRGDSVRVPADPARLRSILLAMVESASWWGEEGPVVIDVAASPEPAIVVRRAGGSLDEEGASDLFVPRPPGSGAGSKVGLFVARGLAEAHRGSLVVERGDGITLRLTLPSAGGPPAGH